VVGDLSVSGGMQASSDKLRSSYLVMGRQPMRIADSCMKKEKEKGKAFQKIDKIQRNAFPML
jgi:hypothetical protein